MREQKTSSPVDLDDSGVIDDDGSSTSGEGDEKDDVIDTLRHMNHRLKRRLKELNLIVERAIDRTDTKRILNAQRVKVDPQHKAQVRDREIQNAEK